MSISQDQSTPARRNEVERLAEVTLENTENLQRIINPPGSLPSVTTTILGSSSSPHLENSTISVHQGNQTHYHVLHGPTFPPPLGPLTSSPVEQQPEHDTLPSIREPPTLQTHVVGPSRFRRIVARFRRVLRSSTIASEQPTQTDSTSLSIEPNLGQLYRTHLLRHGLGDALWIPQASRSLPVAYRQTGVSIGDVGIINMEGGFDFLFNICLPRGPTNERVPDDFSPLSPGLDPAYDIIDQPAYHGAGACLTSALVDRSFERNMNIFSSSASSAAILTMPNGAGLLRLTNERDPRLLEYIARNAESWYRFINGDRRREAQNGDVRVVWGCHKSVGWGIAALSDDSQVPRVKNLRFRCRQRTSDPNEPRYFWDYSGPCTTKAGPELWENSDLLTFPGQVLQNQCLFIRTVRVILPQESWERATSRRQSVTNQPNPRIRNPSLRGRTSSAGSSSDSPTSTIRPRTRESRSGRTAVMLHFEGPVRREFDAGDPSRALGTLLLGKHSNASVAIIDGSDWPDLFELKDLDNATNPSLNNSRVKDVQVNDKGVVYLEYKEQPSVAKTPSHAEIDAFDAILQRPTSVKEKLLECLPSDLFQQEGLCQLIQHAFSPCSSHEHRPEEFPPSYASKDIDRLLQFSEYIETKTRSLAENLALGMPLPSYAGDAELSSHLYERLASTDMPNSLQRAYYAKILARISLKTYSQFGRIDDLDKAIWQFESVLFHTRPFRQESAVLLVCLCNALYSRFMLRHNLRDLVRLAVYFDTVDYSTFVPFPKLLDASPSNTGLVTNVGANSASREPPNKAGGAQLGNVFGHARVTHNISSIISWISQPKTSYNLMWLYGSSSAVNNTVANLNHPSLLTTFTFARSHPEGNVVGAFRHISAELRQAGFIPHNLPLDDGPMSITDHFWTNIGYPMFSCLNKFETHPSTVVLDAVDDSEQLMEVLLILAQLLFRFKIPLRFIVATRRDPRLRDLFSLPVLSQISRPYLVAEPSSEIAPDDIGSLERSLRHQLYSSDIGPIPPEDIRIWNNIITTLIERSKFGHFKTYLTTAVNFIRGGRDLQQRRSRFDYLNSSQTDTNSSQLKEIMATNFETVDGLFTHILSTHPDSGALVFVLGLSLVIDGCGQQEILLEDSFLITKELYSSVFDIMECFLDTPAAQKKQSREFIASGAPPAKEHGVGDSLLAMGLVSLPVFTGSTMPIPFKTPSGAPAPISLRARLNPIFYDYLVNPDRSGRFYVDIPLFHAQLAAKGLLFVSQRLGGPQIRTISEPLRDPPFYAQTWDYLNHHLMDHFASSSERDRDGIVGQLEGLVRTAFWRGEDTTHKLVQDRLTIIIRELVDNWNTTVDWTKRGGERHTNFTWMMQDLRAEFFPHRVPRFSMMRARNIGHKLKDSLHLIQRKAHVEAAPQQLIQAIGDKFFKKKIRGRTYAEQIILLDITKNLFRYDAEYTQSI